MNIFGAASSFFGRGAAGTASIPAVQDFRPEHYMGKWYEIARMPHYFERGMKDVAAEYSICRDGTISVTNTGIRDCEMREIHGVARMKQKFPGTGELEVSFFRPFYNPYRIIKLEPDYSTAMVTSATRDYLWILSRSPTMVPERLDRYLRAASEFGFAAEKLEIV